jgi:hypothetical protein
MSVNVEQAPILHFGQPPFSSPQSPTESQHVQPPASSPPPTLAEDTDMSTSSTLPPSGQRHDREDAVMQDGLTNGATTSGVVSSIQDTESREPPSDIAVEVAAVPADEDAMDTTPDNSQGLVIPNGSVDPQEVAEHTPRPPGPNGVVQGEESNNDQAPPAPTDAVRCFVQVAIGYAR